VKIVLDTNVVVSGVFFGGVPGRILSAWSAGKLALVLSPSILEEYRRVGNELGRQHADFSETFEPLLALLAMHAMIVDAPPLLLQHNPLTLRLAVSLAPCLRTARGVNHKCQRNWCKIPSSCGWRVLRTRLCFVACT
jgi:hypothetical protein